MAYRGIPSIALNTATDQRLRESQEYGVKGMKWGVRKQNTPEGTTVRKAIQHMGEYGGGGEGDYPEDHIANVLSHYSPHQVKLAAQAYSKMSPRERALAVSGGMSEDTEKVDGQARYEAVRDKLGAGGKHLERILNHVFEGRR